MKIAVAGKRGAGKTLVAGGFAFLLARTGDTTLAIDADSAPNLGFLLGPSSRDEGAIVPVAKNEALIAAKTGTAYPVVYPLNFTVDDVVSKYAVPTPAGVHLLVMGTVASMGPGCTCPVNSVIRALLRHLIVDRDEAVVLDMEAGVEHLGRGTAEGVDMMLVISDAHRQSLAIAGRIARMSQDAGIPRIALIGNRIADAGRNRSTGVCQSPQTGGDRHDTLRPCCGARRYRWRSDCHARRFGCALCARRNPIPDRSGNKRESECSGGHGETFMKTLVTMGRAGTGKTSFVALQTKYFIERKETPLLLVDVDPDQNLAEMVGVDLEREGVKTISELVTDTFIRKGGTTIGIAPADRIETRVLEEGLYEGESFDLIAVGTNGSRAATACPMRHSKVRLNLSRKITGMC